MASKSDLPDVPLSDLSPAGAEAPTSQETSAEAGQTREYMTGWRLYCITFGYVSASCRGAMAYRSTCVACASRFSCPLWRRASLAPRSRPSPAHSAVLTNATGLSHPTYLPILVCPDNRHERSGANMTCKASSSYTPSSAMSWAASSWFWLHSEPSLPFPSDVDWQPRCFSCWSLPCLSCLLMLTRLSIILRAFQGIGASGIYAMVSIINPEMVRSEQWGNVVAVVSLVYILSSVLGPILGGLISERSTWRWVFLLK